ncbi:MAG TPA: nucleotidyltransferase family protein [Candidatus Paceibacterota bacterium]|nr:nucleotidyltransferase family protein [Candidatus Paceibacterota bacterium]
MKAVILAAGKGTRMGELSLNTPKPMLKVSGKTLLEHKLHSLPQEITEVILVVGYLKEQIIDAIGSSFEGRKIAYVIQEEQKGTAHALFLCKELLKDEGRFLVMMGDDIYAKEDIAECITHDYSILISYTSTFTGNGAKVIFDESGVIQEIIEKYKGEESGYLCAGMYTITPKIFEKQMAGILNNEVGLPQTILLMKDEVDIKAVKAHFWLQMTEPKDLEAAEEFFRNK